MLISADGQYVARIIASTAVVVIIAYITFLEGTSTTSPVNDRTVWDAVYTNQQASRGKNHYEENCYTCHLPENETANALLGDRFLENWQEGNLNNLFTKIQATMPFDYPYTLSDSVYLDIVVYLLQLNGFPAGDKELTLEELETIRIVGEDGPEPIASFGLVQVVGCLTQSANGEWILTLSSTPVRTTDPSASIGAERNTSAEQSLGTQAFHLLDVEYGLTAGSDGNVNEPADNMNHKVEAKGFLIRGEDRNKINVTSLISLNATCGI